MNFFDGYAIDVSGSTLNIRLMNLDSLLTPEDQFLTSGLVRTPVIKFEADPFPDLLKEQVSMVLYEVNNTLLKNRLFPWGGVSDMLTEYDFEAQISLENSCLNGMLHHKQIEYPKLRPWFEEWDMVGA